jgi:urate oxidase
MRRADYINCRYDYFMPHIHSSSYGESRLRMLRVMRRGDRHDPKDLTIALRFEGNFGAAFKDGDQAGMLPGEAIKNLVHRVARGQEHPAIEALGLAICERLLEHHGSIGLARVEIVEQPWVRLDAGGKAQGQAFTPGGVERRTATVSSNGSRASVTAGLENLVLMRTGGFVPVERGKATEEATADGLPRLFVAALSARWSYGAGDIAFGPYRQGVRAAIVETFAWHRGPTVQETLYAIADVVLASYLEISEVTLSLQERPYRPVDLLELALDGDALFIAHDEPVGVVEITVGRG